MPLLPNIGRSGELCASKPMSMTKTTFQGQLREEKQRLEERLANINGVLEALEKTPEVADILEALNKLQY